MSINDTAREVKHLHFTLITFLSKITFLSETTTFFSQLELLQLISVSLKLLKEGGSFKCLLLPPSKNHNKESNFTFTERRQKTNSTIRRSLSFGLIVGPLRSPTSYSSFKIKQIICKSPKIKVYTLLNYDAGFR